MTAIKGIDLYIIAGPTASGKSAVALELAKLLPVEIISADSRQVFKHLTIGTAKPTPEEIAVCPHHFVDFLEPTEYFSAGVFGDQAVKTVEEIVSRGNIPLVVGGSGLYVKALCSGFFEDNTDNSEILENRKKLEIELAEFGKEHLYLELCRVDAVSAERYIDRNPRRIVRALEHYRTTGKPFSESQIELDKSRQFNCRYFGIDYPREALYERINLRTIQMWQNGLPEETQAVLDMGYSRELNSLNTVGYKETIEFLDGKISAEEAIAKIQQNTRRYAKRQLTWFRNQYSEMIWLKGTYEEIAAVMSYEL